MLYWLLFPLKEQFSFLNVFSYITVRTALAGISALLISLLLGPFMIRILKKFQLGEEIRSNGPKSHLNKKGTPSMGGILIIGSTILPTLLWGNLNNTYVLIAMGTMLSFGAVGFWDDFLKIKMKKSSGLIMRHKLTLQIILSAVVGLGLVYLGTTGQFDLRLSVPFLKTWTPYLGWLYLPWIVFILIGSSNSVNLADGLEVPIPISPLTERLPVKLPVVAPKPP